MLQVGVTLRTVARWEDGDAKPPSPKLWRISAATGKPIEWFFPPDPDELEPEEVVA